jgi:hypothetical protein
MPTTHAHAYAHEADKRATVDNVFVCGTPYPMRMRTKRICAWVTGYGRTVLIVRTNDDDAHETAGQPALTDRSNTMDRETELWLRIRKDEGQKIDPETAEVHWTFAQTLDPYGIHPDLPEEFDQVGREYFARRPGSEIWVHFSDLPDETCKRLWEMYGSRLCSFVVRDGQLHHNLDNFFGPDRVR